MFAGLLASACTCPKLSCNDFTINELPKNLPRGKKRCFLIFVNVWLTFSPWKCLLKDLGASLACISAITQKVLKNLLAPLFRGSLFPHLTGLLIWSALLATLHADYKYPIGIPKAWIDPDVARPTEPADWSKEVRGFYFVDEAKGTDKGRTYGTPTAPRKSIPLEYLGPGSYVRIQGTYTNAPSGITRLSASGSDGNWVAGVSGPVWFVGENKSNRVSFTGKLVLRGSYLCAEFMDNLAGNQTWQFGTSGNTSNYSADHMLLRHSELDGGRVTNATGFGWGGQQAVPPEHLILYATEIHGFGLWDTPSEMPVGISDPDKSGTRIGNTGKNFWLLDNHIHHCSGSGIGTGSLVEAPGGPENVYCGRNLIHHTWATGIAAKTAKNVVWSQNTVHDTVYTSWSGAKGLSAQYAIRNLWVIDNQVYNCDYGFKCGSTTQAQDEHLYVIGNTFYNIQQDPLGSYKGGAVYSCAAISIWGGNRKIVMGNTIVKSKRGICIPSANENEAIIANNIISGVSNNEIWVESGIGFVTIRNNLLFNKERKPEITMGNESKTVIVANSSWESRYSNIVADPLFEDERSQKFKLRENSPAIDKGLSPASLEFDAYNAYWQSYGGGINLDRDGNARPLGKGWDIGAYEFRGEGSQTSEPPSLPKPPSPPEGLRVIK
ncbi:MAG: right-handed parallel beta-helix repeat-containing protein [Alphaproteobacteria bacterium]|nr:MAG: right-handed parallel beta-helix repeat-containing protein [Alphaproteobacteria bacterium]